MTHPMPLTPLPPRPFHDPAHARAPFVARAPRLHRAGLAAATLCAAAALLAGCQHEATVDPGALHAATELYLARHGDLCLGKPRWPIDVTQADARAHARDAVQMPVLQRLGLVQAEAVTLPATADAPATAATRYTLTAEGQKSFIARKTATGDAAPPDFCAAHLTLDRIVGWAPEAGHKAGDGGPVVVTYTYHVQPAPWARDAEAQRVFPMVARVVEGDGRLELRQAFVRGEQGWVPTTGG